MSLAFGERSLTSDDLDRFLRQGGIEGEILHLPTATPTVEEAARAVRASPDQIVKSILFLINGAPALVIACGPNLISRRRLADHFHLSPKRVRLADPQATLATSGYAVGALPPFGHRQPLPTLIDRRVLTRGEVFAGGGSLHALLRIQAQEIARVSQATPLDLVEDPRPEPG